MAGTIQAFIVPAFFEEINNDETAHQKRTLYAGCGRCRGCFFGGGPSSICERRKAQSARNSVPRRGHPDGRWNGPRAPAKTTAMAWRGVLGRHTKGGVTCRRLHPKAW